MSSGRPIRHEAAGSLPVPSGQFTIYILYILVYNANVTCILACVVTCVFVSTITYDV